MNTASFFDPSGNGFDYADLAGVATFMAFIWGSMVGAFAWNSKRVAKQRAEERNEMERRIVDALAARTESIQPTANGNSVNGKVELLLERQAAIGERTAEMVHEVRQVRERLTDHLAWHND